MASTPALSAAGTIAYSVVLGVTMIVCNLAVMVAAMEDVEIYCLRSLL